MYSHFLNQCLFFMVRIFFSCPAKDKNMISNCTVGIPKGLLYFNHHIFTESFFYGLGLNVVVSPDTNKQILDEGVKSCVDDACLPVKVFHGHVNWLKTRCDYLLMPHYLSLEKGRKLCPMLCGLVETVKSSIINLPQLIDPPVFSFEGKSLREWSFRAGRIVSRSTKETDQAFESAFKKQTGVSHGLCDDGFSYRIALIGHSYIVHDTFVNMNIIGKLRALGVGVVTYESVSSQERALESANLFKPPFWYFAREYYGSAVSLFKRGAVDGLIYLSTFSCGVDSVFTELIKHDIGTLPYMVLKLDEHTGEAALDTRIEAFTDMLKRRMQRGHHFPAHGQYLPCRQSVL